MVLIGVAVGVPLGIAAGRAAWRLFAVNVGVVPGEVVPAVPLALLSALRAARSRLADVSRAE